MKRNFCQCINIMAPQMASPLNCAKHLKITTSSSQLFQKTEEEGTLPH